MKFLLLLCSINLMAIETLEYNVIKSEKSYEIRQYEPYLVVSTIYDPAQNVTRRDAFMKLFKYISGENKVQTKIEMTAPVTDSEKISMTAPVINEKIGSKRKMSFMVPSKFDLKTVPLPKNSDVFIEEIPTRLIASIKYSWLSGNTKKKRKAKKLKKWIESNTDYKIISKPIYAGYNSPFTLPPLKRHEMQFIIEKK